MITSINEVFVAMDLPRSSPDFIVKARSIYDSSTKNQANFPQSGAKLSELGIYIAELEKIQAGLQSKPKTYTVEARNTVEKKARTIIRMFSYDVQEAADINPDKAENIILSSGMSIKKTKTTAPKENTIENGLNIGEVIVTSIYSGPHQWQMSKDAGLTAENLAPTLVSYITVTGLEAGEKYWFRQRTVNRNNEYGKWSDWKWIITLT